VSKIDILKFKNNFNCKTSNVIYAIECVVCQKQYIGETEQPFHNRMNLTRSQIYTKKKGALPEHFNSCGHTVNSLETCILEGGFSTDRERQHRESCLISKFNTLEPYGLNRSAGTLESIHCT